MRYGIISDIHSNLEALEVVLEEIEKLDVDKIICLGDIVGYGPNPNECVEKVREVAHKCIIGNHDLAGIGALDLVNFNSAAKAASVWTDEQLLQSNKDFLANLKPKIDFGDFIIVHGSPRDPIWEYIYYPLVANINFSFFNNSICFIGHTHLAESYARFINEEKLEYTSFYERDGGRLKLDIENKRYILNSGSVGQPRDGNSKASFGIYDTEEMYWEVRKLTYPIEKTQKKMKSADLPPILYERLAVGR